MDNKEQLSAVTKEKHPGRVAQGHKLAALMKKRKEELKSEQHRTINRTVNRTYKCYLKHDII